MLADVGARYTPGRGIPSAASITQSPAPWSRASLSPRRPPGWCRSCAWRDPDERESGATEDRLREQLDAVFEAAGAGAMADAVLAYEPVWAIGTGRTASPEQAQAVHAFLRGEVARRDAAIADSLPCCTAAA